MMELSSGDEMLLDSIDMNNLDSIDIERFHKGLFSPSPKSIISSTSPAPSIEQHPPPSPHLGTQVVPQHNQQHAQFQQMQKRIHLGPNFDRLGILNQAHDIPNVAGPYFAKALQQHGGTTLGALLQAHQQTMHQAFLRQREEFLAYHHQQMQNGFRPVIPINPVLAHAHMQAMGFQPPRHGDQIVPEGIPVSNAYFQQNLPQTTNGIVKVKEEPIEKQEVKHVTEIKPIKEQHHSSKSISKGKKRPLEETTEEVTEDEDDSLLDIDPPKNSVYVRYHSESSRKLPSFSEAFSGHIDKLKMKEEHLREILVQHQEASEKQNRQKREKKEGGKKACNDTVLDSKSHAQELEFADEEMKPEMLINNDVFAKSEKSDNKSEIKKEANHDPEILAATAAIEVKCENQESESQATMDQNNDSMHSFPDSSTSELTESSTRHFSNSSDKHSHFPELEFLESHGADDVFSFFESNHSTIPDTSPITHSESSQNSIHHEDFFGKNETNGTKQDHRFDLFHDGLDFDQPSSYENLFNGHTDEHYFTAFKQNNLHLNVRPHEKHTDMLKHSEMLKLMHSPLEFLNDKF